MAGDPIARVQIDRILSEPGCEGRRVLQSITTKWGLLVMTALNKRDLRFFELANTIIGISDKMLSQTLREFCDNGLLIRTVYPSVPPRVSYALTPFGSQLAGHLRNLIDGISDAVLRRENSATIRSIAYSSDPG